MPHLINAKAHRGRFCERTEDACDNDKVAFVTGVTGQDGSYLVELLLSKGASRHVVVAANSQRLAIKTGYVVHGIKRRSSSYNHSRLEHVMTKG